MPRSWLNSPSRHCPGAHAHRRLQIDGVVMLKIVGLLHYAIPIDGSASGVAQARRFYGDLLGLPLDGGRPDIPATPGWWFNVPDSVVQTPGTVQERPQGPPPVALRQIHLIGLPRTDQPAQPPGAQPTIGAGGTGQNGDTDERSFFPRDHVAFAVVSLAEAKAELDRQGVSYRVIAGAVGAEQVFFKDPFGNVIELQEAR